jgi:hypothetical protein
VQTSFSEARTDLVSALAQKGISVADDTTFAQAITAVSKISLFPTKCVSSLKSTDGTGYKENTITTTLSLEAGHKNAMFISLSAGYGGEAELSYNTINATMGVKLYDAYAYDVYCGAFRFIVYKLSLTGSAGSIKVTSKKTVVANYAFQWILPTVMYLD